MCAARSGGGLALQGSRSGHFREDPADLEHGRGGIERQARRERGQLARLGVGVERAFARGSFETPRLAGDQRRREIEKGGIALRRGLLAEVLREVRTARVGGITL